MKEAKSIFFGQTERRKKEQRNAKTQNVPASFFWQPALKFTPDKKHVSQESPETAAQILSTWM